MPFEIAGLGLVLFSRITSLFDTRHFPRINPLDENHVSVSDSAKKNLVFLSFHQDLLCNSVSILYGTVITCH